MKKGFTLVEIIVSITLILIIGTGSIVSFNIIKKKNNIKDLNDMSSVIFNAINVYIETHEQTKKQLYEKKNGVAIPLVTLENEGLIDFQDIDIKNRYVVTMLTEEKDCSEPEILLDWNINGGNVLHICTSNTTTAKSVKEQLTYGDGYYIAKGANPNNWVKFDVRIHNAYEAASFVTGSKEDLWRIVSIDNEGYIKLVYNQNVNTNNNKLYINYSAADKFFKIKEEFKEVYCNAAGKCPEWTKSDGLEKVRHATTALWTYHELVTNSGKKQFLFDSIVNNGWIIETDYHLYSNTNASTKLYMGTINKDEFENTYIMGKTWIKPPFIISGNGFDLVTTHSTTYILDIDEKGNITIQDKTPSEDYLNSSYYNIILNGAGYLPAIVLNSKVKIVKDNNCKQDVPGSEMCPYLLECSEC